MLNGVNTSRTMQGNNKTWIQKQNCELTCKTDKNILLTPQKANFVSSLYGGLKKNEEKHTRHKVSNNKICCWNKKLMAIL